MQPRQQSDSHCQNTHRNPELHITQNCFQHWINLTASFLHCQRANPDSGGIATIPKKSSEIYMTTVPPRSYNVGVTGGLFSCTRSLPKSPWNTSTIGTISSPAAIRRAKLRKSSATMMLKPTPAWQSSIV